MHSDVQKLQYVQYEILKDIKRICEANKISYFLLDGTLLGAVRHKGYIPWDDDTDVGIMRKDMDRFAKIVKEEWDEKYFFQTNESDPWYNCYFPKMRMRGTVQREAVVSHMPMETGIWVDILPLDYVQKPTGMAHRFRSYLIKQLVLAMDMKYRILYDDSKWMWFVVTKLRWILKGVSTKNLHRFSKYLCTRDNEKECQYICSNLGVYGWRRETYHAEDFGEGLMLPFEEDLFCVPENFERVLTTEYGDYMKLPEEETRNQGHGLCEVDFGIYDSIFEISDAIV